MSKALQRIGRNGCRKAERVDPTRWACVGGSREANETRWGNAFRRVKHFDVFGVFRPMDLPRGWMFGLALLLAPLPGRAGTDVREQFEFPNPKHWEEFVAKLEQVLQGSDPAALARFEPEARLALAGLKEFPGSDEYVVWLQERIDYISMAKYLDGVVPELEPAPTSINRRIPHYDLWLQRL